MISSEKKYYAAIIGQPLLLSNNPAYLTEICLISNTFIGDFVDKNNYSEHSLAYISYTKNSEESQKEYPYTL